MISLNLLCPVLCVVAKYESNKDDKVTDFFDHVLFCYFSALLKKQFLTPVDCSKVKPAVQSFSASELYAVSAFSPKGNGQI